MTGLSAFNTVYVYGVAGVLLGVSYGTFLLATALGRRFQSRPSPLWEVQLSKWILVFALVLAPFAVFFGKPIVMESLLNSLLGPPVGSSNPALVQAVDGNYEPGLDRPGGLGIKLRGSASVLFERALGSNELTGREASVSLSGVPRVFGFLLLVWSLGFLLALGRLIWRMKLLAQLIGNAVCIRSVGRVRLLISEEVAVPFSTFALLRADMVIPAFLLQEPADFKVAVRHEAQHQRSGDTLWVLFLEAVVLCFYWNPFVYLWKGKIEELLEFACDQSVLQKGDLSPVTYGKVLVQVAENYLDSLKNQSKPNLTPNLIQCLNGSRLSGILGMAIGRSHKKGRNSLLHRRIQIMFNTRSQIQSLGPNRTHGRKRAILQTLFTGGVAVGSLIAFASLMGGVSQATPTVAESPAGSIFNPEIEKVSVKALSEGIRRAKAKGGFVLVTDPLDGTLLAAAVLDQESGAVLEERESLRHILSTSEQPNSLIKPITAAVALESGKLTVDEKIQCENGRYRVGKRTFGDHSAFKTLTLAEAIAHSSDIGAIKVAQKLGEEKLRAAFRSFGFGDQEEGVWSPQIGKLELGKILPNPQLSSEEFVAEFSNGQNVLVNPLELMRAYGAIANGGHLLRIRPFGRPDGEGTSSTGAGKKILSAKVAESMKSVLERTVTEGTATRAKPLHYSAAGKTGTGLQPVLKQGVAQFIGFAPVQKPRVLIYVSVTGAEKAVWGGKTAAPIFSEIAEESLNAIQ